MKSGITHLSIKEKTEELCHNSRNCIIFKFFIYLAICNSFSLSRPSPPVPLPFLSVSHFFTHIHNCQNGAVLQFVVCAYIRMLFQGWWTLRSRCRTWPRTGCRPTCQPLRRGRKEDSCPSCEKTRNSNWWTQFPCLYQPCLETGARPEIGMHTIAQWFTEIDPCQETIELLHVQQHI